MVGPLWLSLRITLSRVRKLSSTATNSTTPHSRMPRHIRRGHSRTRSRGGGMPLGFRGSGHKHDKFAAIPWCPASQRRHKSMANGLTFNGNIGVSNLTSQTARLPRGPGLTLNNGLSSILYFVFSPELFVVSPRYARVQPVLLSQHFGSNPLHTRQQDRRVTPLQVYPVIVSSNLD